MDSVQYWKQRFDKRQQAIDSSRAEQEVIREAIAVAEANLDGVGQAVETDVAIEIADALAIALAQAMAEVFCDN